MMLTSDFWPENQISPKYWYIEMIKGMWKPWNIYSICNFYRRLILPIRWSDLHFCKVRFFSDNLKIHASQPVSDWPQDTVGFQNLSNPILMIWPLQFYNIYNRKMIWTSYSTWTDAQIHLSNRARPCSFYCTSFIYLHSDFNRILNL